MKHEVSLTISFLREMEPIFLALGSPYNATRCSEHAASLEAKAKEANAEWNCALDEALKRVILDNPEQEAWLRDELRGLKRGA